MTARIKFEDLDGNPLGFVDHKGQSLVGSNKTTKYLIRDFMDVHESATADKFMKYYSSPTRRGGFLYSKLVDSDEDVTQYPEDE